MSEWTSVNDSRKPEPGIYLVYCEEVQPKRTGRAYSYWECAYSESFGWHGVDGLAITHWMPAPPPPEK